METVQQFKRLEESQEYSALPQLPSADHNIVATPRFQTNMRLPFDCGRRQDGPTIEQADNVIRYMKGRADPKFFAVSPRPTGNVGTSHSAVDGRSIVYVVDDDTVLRAPLEALICRAGWSCEFFASAREFLSKPKAAERSCLLLDFDLPDLTGLDLQKKLSDHAPEMPIVFLTRQANVRIAVEAMKRGAIDFLTKPWNDDALLAAIQKAFELGQGMFDNAGKTQAIRERRAALSRREYEVMTLVVNGLLNKQIGFELGISEITVKAHRGQVMRKMSARSLAGLVMMAGQIGLWATTW